MKRGRWLLPVTVLSWPFAVHAVALRFDNDAERIGSLLGELQRVAPPSAVPSVLDSGDGTPNFEPLTAEDLQADPAAAPQTPKKSAKTRSRSGQAEGTNVAAPKYGIRVPSQTVLRLANARVMPQGSFVAAEGARPAGMQLRGVGGFGVGLRDGDVLTQVGGIAATSRSAVVSAVLQARNAHAPALGAIFWRDGEPWRLVVEMPYLPSR